MYDMQFRAVTLGIRIRFGIVLFDRDARICPLKRPFFRLGSGSEPSTIGWRSDLIFNINFAIMTIGRLLSIPMPKEHLA